MSHLQNPSQESYNLTSSDSLESLQTGRYNLAVEQSKYQLHKIFRGNRIHNPGTAISQLHDYAARSDHGAIMADTILGFEAVGVDVGAVLAQTAAVNVDTDKIIGSTQVADELLEVRPNGNGISLSFTKLGAPHNPGYPHTPIALAERISQRFARSPAHIEQARTEAWLNTLSEPPTEIAMQPFDPSIDPLGTAIFLGDIGLINTTYSLAPGLRRGLSVSQIVDAELHNVSERSVQIDETELSRTYTWGQGAIKQLSIDAYSGEYSFSARMDPASNYLEATHSGRSELLTPFIETECGRELCHFLDGAGLMFHPDLQMHMMRIDQTHQSDPIYMKMTRQIARWVNKPEHTEFNRLFVPKDDEYLGARLAAKPEHVSSRAYAQHDSEVFVQQAWASAPRDVRGEAAQTLVSLVDGVLVRNASGNTTSELLVTEKPVEVNQDACIDSASYFVMAAEAKLDRGRGIGQKTENNVDMLVKTGPHGAEAYLLTRPTVFNGVRLPKGAMMRKADDGWGFLRLTPFSFDHPGDQQATGPEIVNTLPRNSDGSRQQSGINLAYLATAAAARTRRQR